MACAADVIAVPGKMTSAFLALQLYLGEFEYIVVPFDQIFETVRSGRADAGLIIHEGQLTYAQSGFSKNNRSGRMVERARPACRCRWAAMFCARIFRAKIQHDLAAILRESIEFGLDHRAEAVQHSMPYARDMGSDLAIKVYRNVRERVHPRLWRSWTRGDPPVSWRSARTRLYRSRNLDRIRNVDIGRRYFFFTPGDGEAFRLAYRFHRRNSSPARLLVLKPLVKSSVPYSKSTTKQKVKKTNRTSQNSPRMRDIARS